MTRVPKSEVHYAAREAVYMYQGSPFTGTFFTTAPDGSLASESECREGLAWGVSKTWYRSGRLSSESYFYRDVMHGTSREWHPNGKLASEIVCELGITLREREWDEDGQLTKDQSLSPSDPAASRLENLRRLYPEAPPLAPVG